MKYQFVLQWPASAMTDFEKLVSEEDLLIKNLSRLNDVDGHDLGSGEANIFILTDDPQVTFAEIKGALSGTSAWSDIRVAYRQLAKESYTIQWPADLKDFSVK